jgi:hypothetical protein
VTEEWRKLHNEKLHISYSSPDIIRQIKSRRMRWAGHVARMEEESEVWWENPKETEFLEDQGVDGRMGSVWILGRWAGGVWIGSSWLRIGAVGGLWRHGVNYLLYNIFNG